MAIHRAAAALKANVGHVLLTTFSDDLAKSLRQKVKLLVPSERLSSSLPESHAQPTLVVASLSEIAKQLLAADEAPLETVEGDELFGLIEAITKEHKELSLSPQFLLDEWNDVVDGWNLHDWTEYRDFKRLGRKTRLGEAGRKRAWEVFRQLRDALSTQGKKTMPMVYAELAESTTNPFHAVIVDECQDVSPAGLRFLSHLAEQNPGELFFAGDLGQRIFQTPFSWSSLGVDIRGRSRTLKINYRTSHQIRRSADRLLDGTLSDVDGNEESRDGTVSVFNGPPPTIYVADDEDAETDHVADWLLARVNENIVPSEIAVFGRTDAQLARARDAIRKASDISGRGLGGIRLATMHGAKGLEFRCVCVIACDDDIIPLEERIRAIGDHADIEDLYNTERHLLYVACTRARDQLLVTGVDPVSEFLEDFMQ